MTGEKGVLKSVFIVTKFEDPQGEVERLARAGASIEELRRKFSSLFKGEKKIVGNIFLNEGINTMWTAICGGSFTPFDNAHAHIGVGDGTQPADATQTGLQGVNKCYKPMDSGYPQYGSDQKAVFRATFGSADANWTWNEWTVANGATDDAVNLNRKVETLGTKVEGTTWVFTVELSLA